MHGSVYEVALWPLTLWFSDLCTLAVPKHLKLVKNSESWLVSPSQLKRTSKVGGANEGYWKAVHVRFIRCHRIGCRFHSEVTCVFVQGSSCKNSEKMWRTCVCRLSCSLIGFIKRGQTLTRHTNTTTTTSTTPSSMGVVAMPQPLETQSCHSSFNTHLDRLTATFCTLQTCTT